MESCPRPALGPWRPGLLLLRLLLLSLAPGAAFAQQGPVPRDQGDRPVVAAPFVSRLRAAPAGSAVLLTWRNPEDLRTAPLVYRSERPITEESFAAAELIARLEPGATRYDDTPPSQNEYHYAVLLEDAEGNPHRLFVPFRNITTQAVRAETPAPEEDLAARISGITARALEDRVEIRFRVSRQDRDLLLFRATSPLRQSGDLLASASPVTLDPAASSYVDYPIPGLDYYYCVVDAGLFKLSKATPIPGENATAAAVQVPVGVDRIGLPKPVAAFRPLPLPLLLIESAVANGAELGTSPLLRLPVPTAPLRPEIRLVVERVLSAEAASTGEPASAVEAPSLRDRAAAGGAITGAGLQLLPEQEPRNDQGIGERAEVRALQDIVGSELIHRDPAGAAVVLQNFLRVPRTKALEHQARFYLGQMYYRIGRYREAALEFVIARDSYYRQAEEWLSRALTRSASR